MIILIDNGHGNNTLGKCSPDGRHREYRWARSFARMLQDSLREKGYRAELVTPELYDVPIKTRCARVNEYCKKYGSTNVLLVSIHNDAKGNLGKWEDARGFSARVSLNASQRSKNLATYIAKEMEKSVVKVRKPLPTQWYWQQNLGICRDTNCPAVLTENLFQDNKEDVSLLSDERYVRILCNAHVNGIINYIKNK